MSKLFELIEQGHIKPIAPIHRFSYADIPSAIRFLRAGKHIGKIVISDGPEGEIKVPVSQSPSFYTSFVQYADVCRFGKHPSPSAFTAKRATSSSVVSRAFVVLLLCTWLRVEPNG